MVDNELNERTTLASNSSFLPSPQLMVDSDYVMSTPGSQLSQNPTINNYALLNQETISQGNVSGQYEIDNRPPSQTLTQLNQSLIDHEEIVEATSAPSSMPLDLTPSSQPSLAPEETTETLDINNFELQVTEDMVTFSVFLDHSRSKGLRVL